MPKAETNEIQIHGDCIAVISSVLPITMIQNVWSNQTIDFTWAIEIEKSLTYSLKMGATFVNFVIERSIRQ